MRNSMKRYVALLRGINVSGKNRIAMSELKSGLEELGYADVRTYLNSGNAVFSVDEEDEIALANAIGDWIRKRLELDIPVFVILQEQLETLLGKAPDWWGTAGKARYDNLIFVMPPSMEALETRLRGRGDTSPEQVAIRLDRAKWEMEQSAKYDYTVVNDRTTDCADAVLKIIANVAD